MVSLFEFKQGINVPAAKYLQDLRQLYEPTNYLAEVPQETLIRDLFISGIASSEAKRLLFREDSDTLTIDCCLHLVTSYESVQPTSLESHPPPEISVSAVRKRSYQPTSKFGSQQCSGCGQQPAQHDCKNCPAYYQICRSCQKFGHFAKVRRQTAVSSADLIKEPDEAINTLHISVARSIPLANDAIFQLPSICKKINMLIDSGSNLTIVNVKTAQRLNLRFQSLSKWLPNVLGTNGFPVKMVGMIPNACIETPKGFLVDNVWVAANLTSEAILGHSSLSAFHALTIRYGGTLLALEVHQVTTTDPETKSSFYHTPTSEVFFPI